MSETVLYTTLFIMIIVGVIIPPVAQGLSNQTQPPYLHNIDFMINLIIEGIPLPLVSFNIPSPFTLFLSERWVNEFRGYLESFGYLPPVIATPLLLFVFMGLGYFLLTITISIARALPFT